jgi:hypothetical protein
MKYMDNNIAINPSEALAFNMGMDYKTKISEYLDHFETTLERGQLVSALWAIAKVWHKLRPFCSQEERKPLDKEYIYLKTMVRKRIKPGIFHNKLEIFSFNIGDMLNAKSLLIPKSKDPRFMFGTAGR